MPQQQPKQPPTNLFEYYQQQGKALPAFGQRFSDPAFASAAQSAGIAQNVYTGSEPQNTSILSSLLNPKTQSTNNGGIISNPALGEKETVTQEPFKGIFGPNDLPASNLINPQTGQLASKPNPYKVGFDKATENGVTEIKDAGTARATIDAYVPSTSGDTQALDFLKTDPFFDNLIKTFQDFINPVNQKTSLKDTYSQYLKDSGIQAIDLELINTKNVIEGSEEDIRTEITKAGGFATESQVIALTNSRNKQLIKNYNTLLETRNSKEKYLNTMIGLEAADRQAADAKFEQSMNFAFQIADYRQKMQTNAIASLDRVKGAIGWQGLLNSTQGDLYTQSLIEKVYGLPQGGLKVAADKEALEKARAEEERHLELDIKRGQIKTAEERALELQQKQLDISLKKAQIAKTYSEIGKPKTEIVDVGGRKFLIDSETGATIKEISTGTKADDQKRLTNLDTIINIEQLQQDGALENAVGPQILKFFTRAYSPGKTNFIAGVEQLVDSLNLDKLIQSKAQGATFGALSDNELRVLASAATRIGTWRKKNDTGEVVGYNVREKDFRRELDKIASLTKRAYVLSGYALEDVGAIQTDDGKIWAQNYDGTMTEIYTP